MAHRLPIVTECPGGWCIAMEKEDGAMVPLTFPWVDKEEAERFLRITRLDLGFVPSRLRETNDQLFI